MESIKKVGFIGAGRLARAFAIALQNIGMNVCWVASKSQQSAQSMAAMLSNCTAVSQQDLANQADLVFITTPDGAIEATVNALNWHAGQAVVHCSGATEISVLKQAQQAGALIGGLHPMQSFGADAKAAVASLAGCTVAIEAEPPLIDDLIDIVAALSCKPIRLPAGARVLYHASGGYAADKVHVLLAEAIRLWQSWGATEEQAITALLPLLKGTLASLERSGVANGMPGPISRGDYQTVAKHRQAIREYDTNMGQIYDLLSLKAVDLAEQAAKLDQTALDNLRRTLKS